MVTHTGELRVKLAPGGYCPEAFCWQGRWYRVLVLESVRTVGAERRCRLGTADGCFELSQDTSTEEWRLRRAPGWLDRMWARWLYGARYPLPPWRRRVYRPVADRRSAGGVTSACCQLDVQRANV